MISVAFLVVCRQTKIFDAGPLALARLMIYVQ